MTTQKEDAESIVGDEIAEDLEEEAKIIGKSEALVIKSEEEVPEVEEKREKPSDYVDDDEEEEDDDKKKKKGKKEVKEDKADIVDENLFETKALHLLEEIKSDLAVEPIASHPLDIAVAELKSVYDESLALPEQDALVAIQEPFEALMIVIQSGVAKSESEEDAVEVVEDPAIAELKSFVTEQFGLLQSQIANQSAPQGVVNEDLSPPPNVPIRRSVVPNLLLNQEQSKDKPKPGSVEYIARRSVGLDN